MANAPQHFQKRQRPQREFRANWSLKIKNSVVTEGNINFARTAIETFDRYQVHLRDQIRRDDPPADALARFTNMVDYISDLKAIPKKKFDRKLSKEVVKDFTNFLTVRTAVFENRAELMLLSVEEERAIRDHEALIRRTKSGLMGQAPTATQFKDLEAKLSKIRADVCMKQSTFVKRYGNEPLVIKSHDEAMRRRFEESLAEFKKLTAA